MAVEFVPSPSNWPGAIFARGQIRTADAVPDLLDESPPDVFTRHAGRAVVVVDGREIVVYSVHLHPSDPTTRMREVDHLQMLLAQDSRSDRPVVLQGDLNDQPDGPEYERWTAAGLRDAFAAVGEGLEHTIKADDPARRLDYVWLSESHADRLAGARVLVDYPFGAGRERSRSDGPFLSDHLPVAVDIDL